MIHDINYNVSGRLLDYKAQLITCGRVLALRNYLFIAEILWSAVSPLR